VARYGLEHRNIMSMTPLMMAACVGNVALAEALVGRGARIDAVDLFGRYPLHFALRSAFRDGAFAEQKLGALFDLLCPSAFELEVDGRLVRLSREQGEFFVLASMMALFHDLYGKTGYRAGGFSASVLDEKVLARFPRSVLPEERRKRTYWNGVLARGEVGAGYRPARKLWRRERHGNYVPSEDARFRAVDDRGQETVRSVHERMRIRLFDEHARKMFGRLGW
jgi:hypothetical protein